MARPIRIQYPDAGYHVVARGNQGRGIFRDDQDRKEFLDTLIEACPIAQSRPSCKIIRYLRPPAGSCRILPLPTEGASLTRMALN